MNIDPPKPFNFKNLDDWLRWKKRFQQFREVSGLATGSESCQVSMLLYCLGEEADNVLASTNITEEEYERFDAVMAKFEEIFKVCQNIIFERAKFNKRAQLEGESTEQYITMLYHLAETCNYWDMKAEMIRDRLVVGIRDQRLSQQLQNGPYLDLRTSKN